MRYTFLIPRTTAKVGILHTRPRYKTQTRKSLRCFFQTASSSSATTHAVHETPRIGVTRGKLALSVSTDDGKTWKEAVLFIEDTLEPGKHIHYPTMVIDGCDLRISYSVSGGGREVSHGQRLGLIARSRWR